MTCVTVFSGDRPAPRAGAALDGPEYSQEPPVSGVHHHGAAMKDESEEQEPT